MLYKVVNSKNENIFTIFIQIYKKNKPNCYKIPFRESLTRFNNSKYLILYFDNDTQITITQEEINKYNIFIKHNEIIKTIIGDSFVQAYSDYVRERDEIIDRDLDDKSVAPVRFACAQYRFFSSTNKKTKIRKYKIDYDKKEKDWNIQKKHIDKNILDSPYQNFNVGFIMLRHMSDNKSKNYYKISYEHIRKYYPENKIIIIDDHSDKKYIDTKLENTLYKTTVINSEYPSKRGELLPYLYFIKNKYFDTAVIVHDSSFINNNINFDVKDCKMIWEFPSHCKLQYQDQEVLIRSLKNNNNILKTHQNFSSWKGCFGGMTIITHQYLTYINNKHNLFNLIPKIKNRYNRMSFERVLACILYSNKPTTESLLGNILSYNPPYLKNMPDTIEYENLIKSNLSTYNELPILKLWTGR